jgi:hypothetical protein
VQLSEQGGYMPTIANDILRRKLTSHQGAGCEFTLSFYSKFSNNKQIENRRNLLQKKPLRSIRLSLGSILRRKPQRQQVRLLTTALQLSTEA